VPKLTADQIIKNLVMDYPADALEFIKPEIFERYGRPVKIDFNIQEIKKHSHFDRSMKNDIAVTYTFGDSKRVILVLIEHWSDKSKFDIYRFAHYVIDLARKFSDVEILPVALFTDRSENWTKQPEHEIRVHCLDDVYLHFKYRLIRVKDHEAAKYIETKNRFIAVLRAAMKHEIQNKIALAVELIKCYNDTENDVNTFEKNMDAIDFFLEIRLGDREKILEKLEEKEETVRLGSELRKRGYDKGVAEGRIEGLRLGREEGLDEGIKEGLKKGIKEGKKEGIKAGIREGIKEGVKEGIKKGKLETAAGMLKEKIPVETISRVTGLTPEEIDSLKKKK
jgi:hypothetical protein